MSDAPSIAQKISLSETYFGSVVSESLMNRIASDSNWIIDNQKNVPVGTIVKSMLSETDFQAAKGSLAWLHGAAYTLLQASTTTWILADGRDITGSTFNTLVSIPTFPSAPDMLGLYERGYDGSLFIGGKFLTPEFFSHTHTTSLSPFRPIAGNNPALGSDGRTAQIQTGPFDPIVNRLDLAVTPVGITDVISPFDPVDKGNQTNPPSVITNFFVRIN